MDTLNSRKQATLRKSIQIRRLSCYAIPKGGGGTAANYKVSCCGARNIATQQQSKAPFEHDIY
jgi:hypothetical protein